MEILSQDQIKILIRRMAIEILEKNIEAESLIFIGLNNNGYRFSVLLKNVINEISTKEVLNYRLKMNPALPLEKKEIHGCDIASLKNKTVILVDDVCNTGRSLFYSFEIFMQVLVKQIQIVVLVDRKHKTFPIQPEIVGLSLATTMHEHIKANIIDENNMNVVLT